MAMPSNISGSFHERMAHLLMRNMAGQKPDALCRSAAAAAVSDDDDNDDESEDEIDAEECDEEEDEGKVWVKALGSYGAHEDGELSLKQGELILLLDYDGEDESGWWEAEKQDGSKGLVPASHVALCDSQGNLKDPLDAARFGAQSTPDDDDNNGGNDDVGDGKKRGGWRERIERKRQEMVSRRIERERSRLSGDTSEAAIRQAVLDEESGYVRAIHSHRTRAKDQLSFKKGAIIYVTEMKEDENVLFGTIISKKKLRRKPKSGWFPANYTILTDAPN